MKNFIFCVLIFPNCQFLSAQTLEEWTRQEKTKIKYLLQQIAANKVYIDYLEKGYKIASNGLQTIRDIRQGDFNLHFNSIDSLKKVNPKIKNYIKVAEIIALQLRIIEKTRQTIHDVKATNQFTGDELNYCKLVFENLVDECVQNIDELVMVITNDQLSMGDDERLKRINDLYADMQDKYAFTSSFSTEMGILSAQRLSEQTENNLLGKINGLQ